LAFERSLKQDLAAPSRNGIFGYVSVAGRRGGIDGACPRVATPAYDIARCQAVEESLSRVASDWQIIETSTPISDRSLPITR
jgi:hypothetical protein